MSARDELRRYVNLLADSWTPRETTDERVEKLHAKVRAEVLREAADALDESKTLRDLTDDHMHDVHAAANELRRMADTAAVR